VRVILVAIAFIASVALAANLGKYNDWPNSPQGYFMTRSERAQWAKLTSEAEAGEFVNKLIISRGPDFVEQVADAAKAADEHLTVAKRDGSKTLRGRIVILLGPPSAFSISDGGRPKESTDKLSSHAAVWRPQTVHVSGETVPSSELRKKFTSDYTFVYAREVLPGKPEKDRVIVVSVNPKTGEDRILDARMNREVSGLLDAAAEARAAAASIIKR
jgi:hypothetical protein